ncbi:hypothetical protein EJK15_64265, partial [Nonomuraea basaltis]
MQDRQRPSRLAWQRRREGRSACGGAVITVEEASAVVERRLAEGELACPDCGGVLARWGWGRSRR